MTKPVEIERKFLVRNLPALDGLKSVEVRQGYLTTSEDSVEIRLRQKGAVFFITLKSDGGLQRTEYEVEIARAQFETLWPATEGRRIEKIRYSGELSEGLTFELDVFGGDLAPLHLVEVEFETADTAMAFTPPEWFGADVTEGTRYKNKALAVHGRP